MKGHSLIVVGSLWGDEGKGKIGAYIALEDNYDMAIRAGTGTNAGHSLYVNGNIIKTNQIPLAGILPNKSGKKMLLAIGSGVCVDPNKLKKEVDTYDLKTRMVVDRLCTIITPEHIKRESEGENYSESHTGSTKSGTGEARVDRVRRIGLLAKDVSVKEDFRVDDVANVLNNYYDSGKKIVIEGTQAHYLSLYCSEQYPVVTSDNCTTMAFADDVGLPWNKIDDVCLVIKSAPTMVAQGCGVLPGEISKEEIISKKLEERGVTTGRLRRKSLTIPFDLLEDAVMINAPTFFALTFCDHVDVIPGNVPEHINLHWIRKNLPSTYFNIKKLETKFNILVKYIEFGKEFSCIRKVE